MINPSSAESGPGAQQPFQYRRMPALPRKIADINPEKDIRVRIMGRILDKYDGTIVVDDGTGKAEIIAEECALESGAPVRVFCRVMPLENGFELRAEIVQNMAALDMDLYKKVHE
jgi:hypothetical protein